MMSKGVTCQITRFFRFMRLFRITMFSLIRTESDRIYAIVAWEEDCRGGIPDEEDVQEVLWIFDFDDNIDDALIVGEYAYDAGWIYSDRIEIDENILLLTVGWDRERATKAVDKLLKIRTVMIDDGEETDAFFLHK